MEAKTPQGLQLPTWTNPKKIAGKPISSLHFVLQNGEQRLYQIPVSCNLLIKKGRNRRPLVWTVSCSSENSPALVLESGSIPALFDESKILKNKSEEIEPYLKGRCIYLVGMMGSGKTTVGKVLSEALGYSFCDCDTLIEEAVGGCTVAEIFKLHGESFFRDNETEVLHNLSAMHGLVISTGGGAVVRPINWKHMQKGISVWLDVPLEALARRITAVGTASRPLLHHESGDPYKKDANQRVVRINLLLNWLTSQGQNTSISCVFATMITMKRLTTLFEERGEAYANADVRISLETIAAKLGLDDVCNITPTVIAIEVLLQLEKLLKK